MTKAKRPRLSINETCDLLLAKKQHLQWLRLSPCISIMCLVPGAFSKGGPYITSGFLLPKLITFPKEVASVMSLHREEKIIMSIGPLLGVELFMAGFSGCNCTLAAALHLLLYFCPWKGRALSQCDASRRRIWNQCVASIPKSLLIALLHQGLQQTWVCLSWEWEVLP